MCSRCWDYNPPLSLILCKKKRKKIILDGSDIILFKIIGYKWTGYMVCLFEYIFSAKLVFHS